MHTPSTSQDTGDMLQVADGKARRWSEAEDSMVAYVIESGGSWREVQEALPERSRRAIQQRITFIGRELRRGA